MEEMTIPPYPAYKDSGLPWLGAVPAHWHLVRTKNVLRERSEKGHPHEPLLAATQTKGVVRKADFEGRTVLALKDLHLLKLVRMGDFVISLRSFQGGIEYARHQGIISPAYTILFPIDPTHHPYLAALFKSWPFIGNLSLYVTGIRQGQNIDYERLSRSYLPIPPANEQRAIVRFLDHLDRKVHAYIRARKKLIALLNEQKQAIIHRAVTRGLDPDVKLKPSGDSWFPEASGHWAILPMRRVIHSAIDGPHFSPEYLESGIPFLSARNIKPDRWSLDDAKFISEADYSEFSRRVVPEVDDVLYTKGGTTGVARVVDLDFRFQVWVHIAVLKVRKEMITSRYLALCLNSPRCYEQSQLFTRGATNQDLGLSRMKNIVLPVPPSLSEQEAIVRAIDVATSTIEVALEGFRQEVSAMREYQVRLIADIVTGKLDVRAAAVGLADEAVEPEPDLAVEADEDGADALDMPTEAAE